MRKIFYVCLAVLLSLTAIPWMTAFADTAAVVYDPATEGVVSGYWNVDTAAGQITGLAPGVTLAQLNACSLPGDLRTTDKKIATGTALTSDLADKTFTAVVTGDINGDGEVTITDLLKVKAHILGEALPQPEMVAGDVNYDDQVTISDFLGIKSCLLGKSQIMAKVATGGETLMLLAPGASQTWEMAAESYSDDGSGIAVISPEGLITAGSGEGTGFVYAHNAEGETVARVAVTVLNGGLTVKLDKAAYSPAPGKSIVATATLNHPISQKLHWQTADPSVCTVNQNGKLTSKQPGSTTLRVTLPNGQFAEATIKVIPPITSMDFENHLHKLKPGGKKQLSLTTVPGDSGEEFLWTSSNDSIATVSETGLVTAKKYGTVTITVKGKYTGKTASCTVKVCDVIQVAITFDDGPSTYTATLLNWLKENEVKATFFLVGNRVPSYKNTVKRIAAEGHELGYHSYAHQYQPGLSTDKIISDFNKANRYLENLTGRTYTLWRTPGGGYNDRVLNAIALPHIMWSVDTRDWETLRTQSVYQAVRKAKDGDIILLHDLYKTSVNGAIKAMKEMQAGNYEFLTVTELLSRKGTPPAPSKSYRAGPK